MSYLKFSCSVFWIWTLFFEFANWSVHRFSCSVNVFFVDFCFCIHCELSDRFCFLFRFIFILLSNIQVICILHNFVFVVLFCFVCWINGRWILAILKSFSCVDVNSMLISFGTAFGCVFCVFLLTTIKNRGRDADSN